LVGLGGCVCGGGVERGCLRARGISASLNDPHVCGFYVYSVALMPGVVVAGGA
jgi:hypothetical protein